MATTYRITNTFLENPTTVLVWAYFSNNTDRSFRFSLTATIIDIIGKLAEEAADIDAKELARQTAVENIQADITEVQDGSSSI